MISPRLIDSRILASSWRIKLIEDTLQYNHDPPIQYARITTPNFALAVAARKKDGKIALVNQFRPGAMRSFWEFPAGLVERRERPIDCIKREFQEEVGYELKNPRLIAKCFTSPSRSAQVAFMFEGFVGRKTSRRLDSNERLRVRFVAKSTALNLMSNRISASNLLALFLSGQVKQNGKSRR
ncbi:MAG: NUDIX hydrolase [Nitrososphaerales archaeon]